MIKKFTIILGALIFLPLNVFAANVFFESSTAESGFVEIKIWLNTEGENLNTVGGSIMFPRDIFSVYDMRMGNSVVNFWIQEPYIENGLVNFSGITPGGFRGNKGFLFSIFFKPLQSGKANLEFKNMVLLRNDGLGTEVDAKTSSLELLVSTTSTDAFFAQTDNEPPETFIPQTGNSEYIFNGQNFLVFSTQDKGVGMDRYFVSESQSRFSEKNWIEAKSPYLLKNQKLSSYISVKAVDLAGNERIQTILPAEQPWYLTDRFWSILIISLAILGFGYYFLAKLKWNGFLKKLV